MTSKSPPLWRSLIVPLILLASCTTATAEPVATGISTIPPFAWTAVALTQTAMPTATLPPPPFTPTPTSLPKFPLDGYVMLFSKDGDLYFQDGEDSPVRLTHVGENAPAPLISDDNQKVIFFREGTGTNAIYSINTDGSNERIIVSNRDLPPFIYLKNTLAFVANTHLLVYNTYDCDGKAQDTLCAVNVSLVDTDTGIIKTLISSYKHERYSSDGNFRVSPDGSMIAIYSAGKIDLHNININGDAIARNIFPYTPSVPDSRLIFPVISWVNNSDKIVFGIPDQKIFTLAYGDWPAYSLWRYQVETNVLDKLMVDPTPMIFPGLSPIFKVSPDGNWILYVGKDLKQYIGNLETGVSKDFGMEMTDPEWSQNSRYFFNGNMFGSIDTPVIELTSFRYWVDSDHFVGGVDSVNKIIGQIINEHVYYYDFPEKNGQILLLMKSK